MATNVNVMDRSFKGKAALQKFGGFLAGMVIPNIGAFIAWGLITAFFIPTGWLPNAYLGKLVSPMISYLLPILIGYTGGKLVHDTRGGVVGAIATAGIVVGADIPMFLGAMIMGPLGGWLIKKFDEMVDGKVPTGFEMLVNNFSAGILGALLALLAFSGIEPVVQGFSMALGNLAIAVTNAHLLPLIAIFIEPGKVLFLNNAINHGILAPLGIEQVKQAGKSIFFLLETDPGPGLGILLAYWVYGKGTVKQSAPGAIIIQFFGGIHEIYFPYILMKPLLLLAVIGGGMAADFTFVLTKAGLVATPSPGSIFAEMAMTPKGGFVPVLLGIAVGAAVSFLIGSVILKRDKTEGDAGSLDAANEMMSMMKAQSKGQNVSPRAAADPSAKSVSELPRLIVFACEAGMGSSAMGESILKKQLKDAGLNIQVKHTPVNQIPPEAEVVFTQESLAARAAQVARAAEIVPIKNFLDKTAYETFVNELRNRS
ncbi:protein-Npi-phosphohistidine-sugar phosphotransferase [Acididesulfobacillus acetoxydans]|uniref:PTS system mannitol-specific EIICB component n=2 Tax=Acididesulfobacillus acetoxydans TaxID=1561005 RepID=A0A8S0XB68_9FIRM|nr:PTS mannitol transporter subunit IICB [Acididesulfobacillus acetoxydans]CAA7600114.1 protein-Npi-phosphohistidine-sugar phosphotransferase [Acididesulfobacillus acetoxydans]CAA7600836.1 protein-Npi-phosphohistidine-sugar phosphotransferase [Acididesulfobacillus acetoxydans]CEJ07642.1 PTS system mannitol-specific EIICB component [Acididesulfobacillus acetoxydans]